MFNLDDVLYNAVSKPLFELLQKWFHWNRFQLISSFLLGEALACAGIALEELVLVGLGYGSTSDIFTGSAFALFFAAAYGKHMTIKEDLKECSRVFESGGYPKPTTKMLMYKARAARRHELTAIFLVLSALMWVYTVLTDGLVSLITINLFLWTFVLFNEHIWRSSDIDPKDRKTLLSAEDTASSSASS